MTVCTTRDTVPVPRQGGLTDTENPRYGAKRDDQRASLGVAHIQVAQPAVGTVDQSTSGPHRDAEFVRHLGGATAFDIAHPDRVTPARRKLPHRGGDCQPLRTVGVWHRQVQVLEVTDECLVGDRLPRSPPRGGGRNGRLQVGSETGAGARAVDERLQDCG